MVLASRRSALGVLVGVVVALTAAGAGSAARQTTKLTPLTLQLAWYVEPEYGAVYAALTKGFFKQQGLDVTVNAGGPQVSATQIVGSGKADVGFLNNSALVLQAVDNGIPITAFGAMYQNNPEGVIFHADHPIKKFADMDGRNVYAVAGSLDYAWLKLKYHLKNAVKPYSYASFAADPTGILIGFYTNAKPAFDAQGISIGWLPLPNAGYNPYANVLFSMTSYFTTHKPVLRKLVVALQKGWVYYRTHAHEINAVMNAQNPGLATETMDQIAKMQAPFVYGFMAKKRGILTISGPRTNILVRQLRAIGVLNNSLDARQIVDSTVVPAPKPTHRKKKG
ncbi:MAG TPA: ABC transporter substrate-binding protein [Gaiellaceae bacterium]|jgi:NitT/TauT family transport system substrate-binding protein|nr:ABC transporter substrate-binding protein [Gaiellaceae bacterium]